VTVDNLAFGWGWNATSQVGDGATTDRLSPVPVDRGAAETRAVAAGALHSLAR
jgi:hypothetical protein